MQATRHRSTRDSSPLPEREELLRSAPTRLSSRVGLSAGVRANRRFVRAVEAAVGVASTDVATALADVHVVELHELDTWLGGPVVAVGGSGDLAAHRAAVALGAAALLGWRSGHSEVQAALTAALGGYCIIPAGFSSLMARRLEEPVPGLDLSTEDLELLQGVAEGQTVDDLASARGCSARHLRRHLQLIWRALGTDGRATGLVRAARWGLVQ